MVSANYLAYQNYIWRKYSGVPMEFYDPSRNYGNVAVIGSQYTITGTGQQPEQPQEAVTYEQPPDVQPHEAYYQMSIPYSYLTPTERFQFNVGTGGQYSAQYANTGYNPAAMQQVTYAPKITYTEKPVIGDVGQGTATYVTTTEAQELKAEQRKQIESPQETFYRESVFEPVINPIEERMAYVESVQGSSPLLYGAQEITRGAIGSVVGLPMLILNPGAVFGEQTYQARTNPVSFGLQMVGAIGTMKGIGKVTTKAGIKAGILKEQKTYEVTEVHKVDFAVLKKTTTEDIKPVGEISYSIQKGIGLDMRMQEFSPKDLMNPKPLNVKAASGIEDITQNKIVRVSPQEYLKSEIEAGRIKEFKLTGIEPGVSGRYSGYSKTLEISPSTMQPYRFFLDVKSKVSNKPRIAYGIDIPTDFNTVLAHELVHHKFSKAQSQFIGKRAADIYENMIKEYNKKNAEKLKTIPLKEKKLISEKLYSEAYSKATYEMERNTQLQTGITTGAFDAAKVKEFTGYDAPKLMRKPGFPVMKEIKIGERKVSFIQTEGMFPRTTTYITNVKPEIPQNIQFRDVGAGAFKVVKGSGNILVETDLFIRRSVPFQEPPVKADGAFKAVIKGERKAFKKKTEAETFVNDAITEINKNKVKPARNMPVESKMFDAEKPKLLLEEPEFYRVPGETLEPGKGIPIAVKEIRPLSAANVSFNVLASFSTPKSVAEGRVIGADMANKSLTNFRVIEKAKQEITPKEMIGFQNVNISLNRQYLEPMRIQESLRAYRQLETPRMITPTIPGTPMRTTYRPLISENETSKFRDLLRRGYRETTRGFKYSPSLYSITTGLTSTKKQSTITGLELRPVIRRRKK